jgi:DNA topoisomerase I
VQLGKGKDGEKPKRASIPKKTNPAAIDLATALRLLALPREVGIHPETGKPIVANFGRYGPFIMHDGKYATLESADDVFTVGINRAVDLLAQKKDRPRRGQPNALRSLGEHPAGGKIDVMPGRYGPYVKWGKLNATIPKDKAPETISAEDAIVLLAARAGRGATKRPAKKPASRRAKASKAA